MAQTRPMIIIHPASAVRVSKKPSRQPLLVEMISQTEPPRMSEPSTTVSRPRKPGSHVSAESIGEERRLSTGSQAPDVADELFDLVLGVHAALGGRIGRLVGHDADLAGLGRALDLGRDLAEAGHAPRALR